MQKANQMGFYRFFKRIIDILLSFIVLVVLAVPMFAIAIIIKSTGKGPVVFKQPRAGKDGKEFTLYKFRTMKVGVEPFGASPKSQEDLRLTKVGKFLREHSLDELPQLFNIFKGDMSIVGPRPLYLSQMAEWDQQQKKRLSVKPGLTGLAQISGRGELTREQKLQLDVRYVETATFWHDAKIILATVAQILKQNKIYEKRYSQAEFTRGESGEKPNQ
jgi:lipopolysaccharide/colanic/teichoic acid biosynthesis glycosyltransferase